MPDNTATYDFFLPTVGGDTNLWGGYLNSNWEDLDDLLDGTTAISGDPEFSGSPVFSGTPSVTGASGLEISNNAGGILTLKDADGTSTFNTLEFVYSVAGGLSISVLDDGGSNVSTDYRAIATSTGIAEHRWDIQGSERMTLTDAKLELNVDELEFNGNEIDFNNADVNIGAGDLIISSSTPTITFENDGVGFVSSEIRSGADGKLFIHADDGSSGTDPFIGLLVGTSWTFVINDDGMRHRATQGTYAEPRRIMDLGEATDGLLLPGGTTAQRPGSPLAGDIRWNSSLSRYEGYDGSNWLLLSGMDVSWNVSQAGTFSLLSSRNVSSAVDLSVGTFSVNFNNALASTNSYEAGAAPTVIPAVTNAVTMVINGSSTTQVTCVTCNTDGTNTNVQADMIARGVIQSILA